jgi:hypothetical protein
LGGDLSKYREFRLGSDLATVAKQAGESPAQAKSIHVRPALIQELEWRPQPVGAMTQRGAVQGVVFGFYNGELYRIAVKYDRYEIEGLTAEDLVEAISVLYGTAATPLAAAKVAEDDYGERNDVIARWQDSQYRFDLIRSSYGPSYMLVGVLKRLESQVQNALLEAKRLDDKEAPQREAARIASEGLASKARLEQLRQVNRPKFRP